MWCTCGIYMGIFCLLGVEALFIYCKIFDRRKTVCLQCMYFIFLLLKILSIWRGVLLVPLHANARQDRVPFDSIPSQMWNAHTIPKLENKKFELSLITLSLKCTKTKDQNYYKWNFESQAIPAWITWKKSRTHALFLFSSELPQLLILFLLLLFIENVLYF